MQFSHNKPKHTSRETIDLCRSEAGWTDDGSRVLTSTQAFSRLGWYMTGYVAWCYRDDMAVAVRKRGTSWRFLIRRALSHETVRACDA